MSHSLPPAPRPQASQRIGAWPPWMKNYAKVMLVVAAGSDFIGGPFFERAFDFMMLIPMLAVPALLPIMIFGLLLGVLGGRS